MILVQSRLNEVGPRNEILINSEEIKSRNLGKELNIFKIQKNDKKYFST
jgi:hypothetical protein